MNMVVGDRQNWKQNFLFCNLGLVLCRGKKTFSSIARVFSVSHDTIRRTLCTNKKLQIFFPLIMEELIKKHSKVSKGWFIVDDTLICKIYGKFLEGLTFVFNVLTFQQTKGLTVVVVAWSNGIITIPVRVRWFFSKEVSGPKHYQKKSEVAAALILELSTKIPFNEVVFDCHYSTAELMKTISRKNVCFIGKIPRNRVITTPDGVKAQLQNHPSLKLYKNERSKKVTAFFQGLSLFFSVHKKRNKLGNWTLIYHVSNVDKPANIYHKIYEYRWKIEMVFRTSKQKLGLAECQSTKIKNQSAHVLNVLACYALLEDIKISNNLKCPEEAISHLQEMPPGKAKTIFGKHINSIGGRLFRFPPPEVKFDLYGMPIFPANQNIGGVA